MRQPCPLYSTFARISELVCMNIGDRVRLVHGREEGIITKFLPGDLVEVEIEAGFRIPVQRREVSLISPEEKNRFRAVPTSETPKAPSSSEVFANQGLYLAFVPVNDRELSMYIINNTDWDVPFSLINGSEPHFKSLGSGLLKARSSQKTGDWQVKDFENWGVFTVQALFSRLAFRNVRPPLEKKIRFRANSFFKTKQRIPVLDQVGHLFQVDDEAIQPEKIKESLTERKVEEPKPIIEKPETTVDLHIEKLTRHFLAMDTSEMLELQLKTFNTALENAIAHGLDEIIFIHGVGNGTLRTEIHRKLGRHPHVAFFADAQKEKFGYGATRVKIK